ncbi:MAG: sigma 54-interacting transcriptional regulator [Myxococcota bacterium]
MGGADNSMLEEAPRSKELEALTQWFDGPTGTVALIRGRGGVGKSHLVDGLLRTVTQRPQVAVFEARVPDAGGRSFHPFAEIAHQALLWAEQSGLTEQVVDPVYSDISGVLDHAVTEDDDEGPSLDQKLRFFEGFRRLLDGVGKQARLLVVVRDLERADPDTLELASYLADELFGDPALDPEKSQPGLLVLTCRDDEVSAAVEDFVEEMAPRPSVQSIRLQGLDLEGLRRYVQSRHVLEKLLAASEGLPQELDALLDALPRNVEELFERKLAELDPQEREALSALAVSGRSVSARLLAVVTGQPGKQIAKALNRLREDKILDRRISNGEFQFSFMRRRDLEVTERFLVMAERARLHSGWAETLAREPDQGAAALIAYHQLRSETPSKGVPLAIQAAETYAVGGALHAALEMLESALEVAAGELRVSILSRLAELSPLTGSPRRALRYVAEWKAALPAEQQGRAMQREAELHNAAGDYDAALVLLEQARSHTPSDAHLERAKIEATGAEALYHKFALDEATEAGANGLDLLAASEGDSPTRLRLDLLNLMGKAAFANGALERAVQFFEETLAGAEKSGLSSEQSRALINLGLVRMQEGELERAAEHLKAGIDKASEAGDLSRLGFGYLNLGTLLHQRGDLGPAMECYRECKSLFRRLGNRTQLARTLSNFGNLLFICGDMDRARAHNDESRRLAQQSGVDRLVAVARVVEGIISFEEGKRTEGEAEIREGMSILRRIGSGERPVEAMLELVEGALRFQDPVAARRILTEAEEAVGEAGTSASVQARMALLAGSLALSEGLDGARIHFEAARAVATRLGRRMMLMEADLGLSRSALRDGDKEEARQHLARAEAAADEISRGLPDDVRSGFEAGRTMRNIRIALAEVEGRAVPVPNGVPPISPPARPAARIERKQEWRRRYGSIIGTSAKLMKIFHILDRVAESEGTVLIVGESGTGKELVAEAIHRNSPRAKGPFVKLNCAALVETLLLSELFGHERGSFTGAHQRKIGRFEMAAGGTLFLDEIGDISPKTQVALLRVLQEREFERVGGGKPIKVDARIIFATNRNLPQMVRDGGFREDLFYRIKGIQVDLPPLRERRDDIVPLAQHFLAQYAAESGSIEKKLSPGACALLTRYGWPGNIRELENIVRSVALFAEGETMTDGDFDEYRELFQDGLEKDLGELQVIDIADSSAPIEPPSSPPARTVEVEASRAEPTEMSGSAEPERAEDAVERELLDQVFDGGVPLPELKKMIQLQAITRALRMTGGNITKAADVLGMRRPRLSQIINGDDELKALCQGASK